MSFLKFIFISAAKYKFYYFTKFKAVNFINLKNESIIQTFQNFSQKLSKNYEHEHFIMSMSLS